MFAQAKHIDITNDDHFIVIFCKDGIVDHIYVLLMI